MWQNRLIHTRKGKAKRAWPTEDGRSSTHLHGMQRAVESNSEDRWVEEEEEEEKDTEDNGSK